MCRHRRAGLHKRADASGVIAVMVGDGDLRDRIGRKFSDRGFDLVVQWGELRVDHQDRVVPDGNGDIPALSGKHIGLVAQILSDDFHFAEIGRLRERRSREKYSRSQGRQRRPHGFPP